MSSPNTVECTPGQATLEKAFTSLVDNSPTMEDETLELLITTVVAADDERQARAACDALLGKVDGRIVQVGDCSDEEPGCWSVTISLISAERATHNTAAALARAVRTFVRRLGDEFPTPRVACEPPTAWTVLEDPDLLDGLVPGAERVLVEAWSGGDPYGRREQPESAPEPAPEPSGASETRLSLRVDVATDRSAGAEWQARAIASRIVRTGTITRVAPQGDLLSVHVDLGPGVGSPTAALLAAVSSLGRSGWSPVEWSGDSAAVRWSASPRPTSGITAMELVAAPPQASAWTPPS
jgi:hypothetical protein